jgi:thiamine-monophosphate kinase
MGAAPGEAYVAVGIPDDFGDAECLELLDGMAVLAAATGTSLAGGDLTRSERLFLTIAVVGHAPTPDAFVRRSGARPGDALVLTGEIGGAAAGLELLDNPHPGTDFAFSAAIAGEKATPAAAGLVRRQLEPLPRLAVGRALARVGARAMIDLSDGLGGDAAHLAESSGVGLEIDAGALPLAPGVEEVARAAGREPYALAVGGGEDYELLASIPPERLDEARHAVAEAEKGIGLKVIGAVNAGSKVEIRLPGGEILEPGGFDQLA